MRKTLRELSDSNRRLA